MTMARQTRAELLAGTSRSLREKGYDIIEQPDPSLLPESLATLQPDAIAIGKEPKLVIEIAGQGSHYASRIADMQKALKNQTDWKLHLVVHLSKGDPEMPPISESNIRTFVDSLGDATTDARANLLMAWAALEALSRKRRPQSFSRPQSPGRIVEEFATEGVISPSDAAFLRTMAYKRNAFVHGDLSQIVSKPEIDRFIAILEELMQSPVLREERQVSVS